MIDCTPEKNFVSDHTCASRIKIEDSWEHAAAKFIVYFLSLI